MIDPAAAWETVRQHAPLPSGTRAILIVGSTARGWANPGSDIDVVVIGSERPAEIVDVLPVPLEPATVPCLSWYVESLGWELKYWLVEQVEQMLDKVTWDSFEGNQMAGQSITEQEELFLERLFTALPLSGAEWLQDIRAQLTASAFRTLVVSRSLGFADKAVVDALGQAEVGDLVSAVLSARSAYEHAVDALLESHDMYGTLTTKWRARRVQEAAVAVLPFDDYWTVETMATLDRDNLGTWVNDTVKRARRLMMETEI